MLRMTMATRSLSNVFRSPISGNMLRKVTLGNGKTFNRSVTLQHRFASGSSRTELGIDPARLTLDTFYSLCFFGTVGMVFTGGYVLYVSGSLEKLADSLAVETNKVLVETYGLEMTPQAGTVVHSIENPPPSLLQQAASFLVGYESKYIMLAKQYEAMPNRGLMETLEYWNAILSVRFAVLMLGAIDLVPKDPFPPLPSSYKSAGTHVQIQYRINNMVANPGESQVTKLEENIVEAFKSPIQMAKAFRNPEHTSAQVSRFINATIHANLLYRGKEEGWSVENIIVDFPTGAREYPYGFDKPQIVNRGPRTRKGWFF